jgi:hypothetical protein
MNTSNLLTALLNKKVAEIEGISPTSVRRVLNDKQNNDQVIRTYLMLEEEILNAIEGVGIVRKAEHEFSSNKNLKSVL